MRVLNLWHGNTTMKKRNNLSFFFEISYVGCVFIMSGKNQSFDKSENTVNNVSKTFKFQQLRK